MVPYHCSIPVLCGSTGGGGAGVHRGGIVRTTVDNPAHWQRWSGTRCAQMQLTCVLARARYVFFRGRWAKVKDIPTLSFSFHHPLHTRMEKVYTQLNKLLNAAGDSPSLIFLKGQALVTLTTILLEFEVIRTQPRVFESFVGRWSGYCCYCLQCSSRSTLWPD